VTLLYLPQARVRRIRENLEQARSDLAWLAAQPGDSQGYYVLAGMRVDIGLDLFERAVKGDQDG